VKRGILFVFATVMVDMLGVGLIAPVLPQLLLRLTGNNAARTASVFGVFGATFALMQFLCSPLLGMLSDRFGRKPVLVLSNLGLSLDYVLMALSPTVGWLFAGRVIAGITSASMATASAYVADVTEPQERARSFGLLGVAFGLGFIAGPALGGVLGAVSLRLPFWFAAGLSLANAAYSFFLLPESLPHERRNAMIWRRANPFGSLQLLRSHPQLTGLASVSFLNTLAGVVLPSIYVLYVEERYGWSSRSIGFSLMLLGLCSGLTQAALVKPVVAVLGERKTMLLGLLCGAAGMVVFGTADTSVLFACGIPCIAAWGLAPAAAQSVLTGQVGASEQGQLQGALMSLSSIAALLGPGIFTSIYARSFHRTDQWNLPGIAWLLAGFILFSAAFLMLRVTRPSSARMMSQADGERSIRTFSSP
jgi:DHA1 family tetracycline resistance protein-like MFS transporter